MTELAGMQTMQVTCPDGAGPGQPVTVQAPSGQMVQVVVPDGIGPGMIFMAQIPAPAVAMATAVAVPAGGMMMAPQQRDMGSMGPYDALASLPRVEVQEKANMVQAITAVIGVEIDMANKYKVLDDNGQEFFFFVEQTDFLTRQLKRGPCADCVGWNADVLYTLGGRSEKFLHMSRDFSLTCCCFNRPVVDITDVSSGQKIGAIKDPFACCDLTFSIMDGNGEDALYAKGGCCQLGLCCPLPFGPCAEVSFTVTDAKTDEEVGFVTKKVPNCLKWLIPGETVDNYHVEFHKVTHPQWKAMLMVLAVFIDFRYFSESQDPSEIGDQGLIGMMS